MINTVLNKFPPALVTRSWRHPLVLTVAMAMGGMAFYLVVNGVLGLAMSMSSDVTDNGIVKNWPRVLAGMVWISAFTAAVIQCLRYLYKLSKLQVSKCDEFKELETLAEAEASELSREVEGTDCGFGQLKEMWR